MDDLKSTDGFGGEKVKGFWEGVEIWEDDGDGNEVKISLENLRKRVG